MASGGKNEEVLLAVNHVRSHRDDGTLYLLTERLAWAPAAKQNITLSLKYADMKQQKISPESKEKIQMQIVMTADAVSHVFQFINAKGREAQLEDRSQVVEMLQPLIQKFQRKITSEIENKNRVLASNPTLFQLYKDLVVSGIVTAEEFWTCHAKELEEAASTVSSSSNKTSATIETPADSQRVGIQASFLANLRPHADEESGGIRYNLTADTIEAIFRTYPSVKLKHAEYVPHSMSEGDFWAHFFQSHYFHRDRLETGKDLFSGDQVTAADSQTIASLLENDPFVNVSGFIDSDATLASMAAESGCPDQGSTNGTAKSAMSKPQLPAKLTPAHINRLIVQRMNFHSERVLSAQVEEEPGAGSLSKQLPKTNPAERVLISDLLTINDTSIEDAANFLDIANAESYSFCATYDAAEKILPPSDINGVIDLFRNQLSQYQPSPYSAFQDEHDQYATMFNEITSSSSSNEPTSCTFASICGGNYSSALESEYKGLYAALGELLRHFWTCFPVTTPHLEQKLTRMRETLATFRSGKLKSFEQRLATSGVQSVQAVTGHMNVMLDIAQRRYDNWQSRKSGVKH